MKSSRDSSVWKSIATAFGDGLAFGVGMHLSQNAARRPETSPRAELAPPPPFERKALEAVVNALEERLKEHATQVERSVAAIRHDVDEELAGMRVELAAKDADIGQLRRQIAESDCASRELLTAVGQACLKAAARVTAAEPGTPPEHTAKTAAATD